MSDTDKVTTAGTTASGPPGAANDSAKSGPRAKAAIGTPGDKDDPNAPTEQEERAAKEQDDGAIPSPSY